LRAGYDLITEQERARGQPYEWILRTRTDVVLFADLGAMIATAPRDRVYAPRNGMNFFLSARCQNDLLFWCPRELCRPYFTLLEIFESPHCRGAAKTLDATPLAVPSIFAVPTNGTVVPNGKDGPPQSPYWLPYAAQTGPACAREDCSDACDGDAECLSRDIHFEAEFWWVARYSRGQRCSSFGDRQCCGLIDDVPLPFALAQYAADGNPSLIDCSARMLLMSPRDEEADIRNGYDPQSEPGERTRSELGDTYEACVRMSEQWAARGNVTSLLGPL